MGLMGIFCLKDVSKECYRGEKCLDLLILHSHDGKGRSDNQQIKHLTIYDTVT